METAKQIRDRLGTDVVVIVSSATKLLKNLDPVIGVAGKEAPVKFRFAENSISTGVQDEASIMRCIMDAKITFQEDSAIFDYICTRPSEIPVSIEHLVRALKAFGDECVCVTVIGAKVCMWNDCRRRSFTLVGDNVAIYSDIDRDSEVNIPVPVETLRELAGLKTIGETLFARVDKGRLTFSISSDVETAEIFVPSVYTENVTSSFGSEVIADIVRKIHSEDDVLVGLSTDYPIIFEFRSGAASYRIHVAPRILEDS